VAACLFDPISRIGGMNHFMLPQGSLDDGNSTRFGVNAMEKLINEILKLGGERRRLRAKVFGAGHVLNINTAGVSVPEQNALFIKAFLATEGIPIMAQRLGGVNPLQVHFLTDSGKALLRIVGSERVGDVLAEEERYRVDVVKETVQVRDEGITLF
jgi:chemotaxis receptor (MCP) glutamine deamidase CheD